MHREPFFPEEIFFGAYLFLDSGNYFISVRRVVSLNDASDGRGQRKSSPEEAWGGSLAILALWEVFSLKHHLTNPGGFRVVGLRWEGVLRPLKWPAMPRPQAWCGDETA